MLPAPSCSILIGERPSDSVSAWLDYDKRLFQLPLTIRVDYSFKLPVHRILRRRQHPQIQYSCAQPFHEHQASKVSVSRDKHATLFLR